MGKNLTIRVDFSLRNPLIAATRCRLEAIARFARESHRDTRSLSFMAQNECRGIRGSLFSVPALFHRDHGSPRRCFIVGRPRGRARISAKIGERALGDTVR